MKYSLIVVATLVLAPACATFSPHAGDIDTNENSAQDSMELEEDAPELPAANSEEWLQEIIEADEGIEAAEPSQPKPSEIPMEINSAVRKWVHYFAVKDRDRFQRYINNGEVYREMVEEILEKNNVPKELYFLALIESGFQLNAISRARAVGPWQFMRSTGKLYGLQADYYIDERRDPIRATEAAARHLKDLHDSMKSWHLAMAAYNAGERRISKAIRKGKSRDFWTLARKHVLPRETKNYVPKFLAAVIIGRNPEKYGFKINDSARFEVPEAVLVPSPVRLRDVAQLIEISPKKLAALNPNIRKGVTAPNRSYYSIWVPRGDARAIESKTTELAALRVTKLEGERKTASTGRASHAKSSQGNNKHYKVRLGDNLYLIAKRFRTSVAALKRINGLNATRIYPGQLLRVGEARKI